MSKPFFRVLVNILLSSDLKTSTRLKVPRLRKGIYKEEKSMEIFDELSAANLPSGVYFYSLEFKGKSITKKMLILK